MFRDAGSGNAYLFLDEEPPPTFFKVWKFLFVSDANYFYLPDFSSQQQSDESEKFLIREDKTLFEHVKYICERKNTEQMQTLILSLPRFFRATGEDINLYLVQILVCPIIVDAKYLFLFYSFSSRISSGRLMNPFKLWQGRCSSIVNMKKYFQPLKYLFFSHILWDLFWILKPRRPIYTSSCSGSF